MRPNVAARCWASTALACVMPLMALGCSGGDGVPLGGPFGGTVYAGVQDAGGLGDGSGVADLSSTASGVGVSGNSSAPPTWTQLFNAYMAVGKVGNCGHAGCHQGAMDTPPAAFSWLQSRGQVGPAHPALMDSSSSCLTWFGGDMPPGGPDSDPVAEKDFDGWLKAGAMNN
jgi:hypothetical protein